MRKPKTDRLLMGVVGTSMALASLAACSTSSTEELVGFPNSETATTNTSTPPSPEETGCETWTWDAEAEAYQCVEEGSENNGHYYSNGSWFPTIAAFMAGRALGGAGSSSGVTNQRQDGTTNNNQQTNQNRTTNTNQSTTSPNQSNQNSTQSTNSRSGMGGGGFFGG
ncbi:hypothetical protein [Bacillus sp. FJAT-45037]|uniref:hypothetical protein n=1 Tax=Bacillus sp. FJAT-45037 TaxID=2011007 RepID=UPI0012FD3C5C|nr:hypothetical protein [Bacillus sp. FJAT-45037]